MAVSHADKHTRIIKCGQQRIATALGMNRHTVSSNLRKLEQRGLLKRLYRMPPPKSLVVWQVIDKPQVARQEHHTQPLKLAPRTIAGTAGMWTARA